MVTVKCRHCSAEIAVDASDPATKPSQEAPRRGPAPPRPKGASVTKMGLGLPAPPIAAGQSATGTPFPAQATATPSPHRATATPPVRADATSSFDTLWDDDDKTLLINAPKGGPRLPAPPHPPHPPQARKEEEPELIDADEIPASSSGAPSLDTLKQEAARPELRAKKRAPDQFLVNLSAGTQGILGAPTIDVSGLDSPPESIDAVEIEEEEAEPPTHRGGRGGTQPLFDMSAVLPAAGAAPKPRAASVAAARAEATSDAPASVSVPAPESKARERKFVVAPLSPTESAPKARRAGAAVWFGLVAVAAGVVAVIGLRGHQPKAEVTTEPSLEPSAAPVASVASGTTDASEASKAAVSESPTSDSIASEAPSAPANEPSAAPKAPATASIASAVSVPSTPIAHSDVKAEPALEKPAPEKPAPEKPALVEAAPTLEKPVVAPTTPSKPVEVHNAPPPAADGTEFDKGAARSALASAAAQASACRKDGDPSGMATITITFAPSGRITSANLQGPPFAGTATGGCIANTMRRATVPAFSGEHVTVTKTIVVE